jgi:hypothetical protein
VTDYPFRIHHLEQNSIIVSLGLINIIDATVIEAKQKEVYLTFLSYSCAY